LWLGAWLGAQALRVWAIASLGAFWNVRVWVLPGTAPIARGPYRWLRHPNYIAVAAEFVAGPIMFGAWRTALVFSLLNAVAMMVRIPVEERALAWAATPRDPSISPGPHPKGA
jgi:methyltransferase